MQKNKAIKTSVFFIIVAAIFYFYFTSKNHSPEDNKLISSYEICSAVYVKIILDDSGGATVPNFYSYYLMKNIPTDNKMKNELPAPVLVSDSPNAKIRCDNKRVYINFVGKVFEFTNRVLITDDNGEPIKIDFSSEG